MTIKNIITNTFLLIIISVSQVFGQNSKNQASLSKNAPKDNPTAIYQNEQKKFDKQIAPYVKKARETLLYAKNKFLSGLSKGEGFFLTIRLFDRDGEWEQVFIRVTKWSNNKISGYIDSDLGRLKEYKTLQNVDFNESDILDWLFTKPDGSEEGNYVGKYLDTLH